MHIHVLLRYIQPYCHIAAYLELCVTLVYSEPCHVQNPGIFRTYDTFRTLSRHILAYSEQCVTIAYWEPCHIQNFAIFRNLTCLGLESYSESCYIGTFRHIQAYSMMIVITTLTLLFVTLVLHTFQRNKKKHVFLTTMASISMLDWVYLNNTRSFKTAL